LSGFLLTSWFLCIGFIPLSSIEADAGYSRGSPFNFNHSFAQTAGIDFNVSGYFRVWTEIEIRETKSKSIYFDPYRGAFRVGAEFLYKNFSLGILHECDHDIVTGNELNRYNGLETSFNEINLGWSSDYRVHANAVLSPAVSLGLYLLDGVFIKDNNSDHYFERFRMFLLENRIIYTRIQGTIDLFGLAKFRLAVQGGYSATNSGWNGLLFDMGLEAYYRNLAGGIRWKNQLRLADTAMGLNELSLYITIKGSASVF